MAGSSSLRGRLAASRPAQWLANWQIPGMGPELSRQIGLGALGSVIAAGSQLLNNQQSTLSGVSGALGSFGGIPGTVIGANLGRPFGPAGRIVGGLAGGIGGAMLGSEGLRTLAQTVSGENEDPLLKQARSQAQAQAEQMRILGPGMAQQASLATTLEMDRTRQLAEIERQRMQQQVMAQSMMNAGQNTAALQQQLLAAIFGGGVSV